MLEHPPGIELVLRKRICLRIIKKVGLGTSFMKLFSSGPTHTETGVMYEVVTGIPKVSNYPRSNSLKLKIVLCLPVLMVFLYFLFC